MVDTILVVSVLYPDGTMTKRTARIGPDGNLQVRLNFHDGRLGRALELRQLRLAAAETSRPGLKPVPEHASTAAGPMAGETEGGTNHGNR